MNLARASSWVVLPTSSCCLTCRALVLLMSTSISALFSSPLRLRLPFWKVARHLLSYHYRLSRRHLHTLGCAGVQSTCANDTPLTFLESCFPSVSSSARMKYNGDVMSPWRTPRLIGKVVDEVVLHTTNVRNCGVRRCCIVHSSEHHSDFDWSP